MKENVHDEFLKGHKLWEWVGLEVLYTFCFIQFLNIFLVQSGEKTFLKPKYSCTSAILKSLLKRGFILQELLIFQKNSLQYIQGYTSLDVKIQKNNKSETQGKYLLLPVNISKNPFFNSIYHPYWNNVFCTSETSQTSFSAWTTFVKIQPLISALSAFTVQLQLSSQRPSLITPYPYLQVGLPNSLNQYYVHFLQCINQFVIICRFT